MGRESQIDSMKTPLRRKNFVLIPSGETLYDGIHTYIQIYQLFSSTMKNHKHIDIDVDIDIDIDM